MEGSIQLMEQELFVIYMEKHYILKWGKIRILPLSFSYYSDYLQQERLKTPGVFQSQIVSAGKE